MKDSIKQILPLWELKEDELRQIYSSAWEVGDSYVIKVYSDKVQLERNIKISTILAGCNIPVAEIMPTKTGEKYVEYQNTYFLLSKKLQGSNLVDFKDRETARKMGCAIARLHLAFLKCEKEVEFWDNSLLEEMEGWIQDNLSKNDWQIISKEEYARTLEQLRKVYGLLPKQLIHRDVHFGNFLFLEGNFSGYIDFDLTQKNIRIFDICYFLTGLLAEETQEPLSQSEWLELVKAALSGYESITRLLAAEKEAIPCVMECIEILFAAYFIGVGDLKSARKAYDVFRFVLKLPLRLSIA